jgi:hypothetical protein
MRPESSHFEQTRGPGETFGDEPARPFRGGPARPPESLTLAREIG